VETATPRRPSPVINTPTGPTATSSLSVHPAGQTRPTTSNLNFGNKVTFYNAAGTVNILADLAGY
jgi:hypothetical protein